MNNDINSSAAAIGIDLGGTKTEAIILNLDGSVLWRQRRPTPRADGYDAVLAIVAQMILEGVAQLSGARNPLIAFWMTLAALWGG